MPPLQMYTPFHSHPHTQILLGQVPDSAQHVLTYLTNTASCKLTLLELFSSVTLTFTEKVHLKRIPMTIQVD